MNKTLLIVAFLMLIVELGMSCSCSNQRFFCEYIKRAEPTTALRVIAVEAKSYSGINEAVYLKVVEILRDDFGITDTIKVYGMEHEASCGINVIERFPVGEERFLAFGQEAGPISNPDSLQENYYETRLFLCATSTLRIIDDKVVKGAISENALIEGKSGLYEYPLKNFRENLKNCSFNIKDLNKVVCENNGFLLYPNPYSGGKISISTDFRVYQFEKVQIYSSSGQLILNMVDIYNESSFLLQRLGHLPSGIYFIAIHCGEERIIKKFVVQ